MNELKIISILIIYCYCHALLQKCSGLKWFIIFQDLMTWLGSAGRFFCYVWGWLGSLLQLLSAGAWTIQNDVAHMFDSCLCQPLCELASSRTFLSPHDFSKVIIETALHGSQLLREWKWKGQSLLRPRPDGTVLLPLENICESKEGSRDSGSTPWRLSKSHYEKAPRMGKIVVTGFQINHRHPYGTCCLCQSILKLTFQSQSHFFSLWVMGSIHSPLNACCVLGLETFSALSLAPTEPPLSHPLLPSILFASFW